MKNKYNEMSDTDIERVVDKLKNHPGSMISIAKHLGVPSGFVGYVNRIYKIRQRIKPNFDKDKSSIISDLNNTALSINDIAIKNNKPIDIVYKINKKEKIREVKSISYNEKIRNKAANVLVGSNELSIEEISIILAIPLYEVSKIHYRENPKNTDNT